MKISKRLYDLFSRYLVPLPRSKKVFYKKHIPLSSPRKLAHLPIDILSTDMNKFEERKMMEKRPFAKNT